MKYCGNCGKENEDALVICAGCGAVFPTSILQAAPPLIAPPFLPLVPPAPRELKAGLAIGIFGVYLGAQVIGGFIAGLLIGISHPIQAGVHAHSDEMQAVMLWAIFLAMLLGGIAVVWTVLAMELPVKDTSPTGPAWVRGSRRDIAKGLATGVIVSLFWLLLLATFGHQPQSDDEVGPMTRMGLTAGFGRIMWITMALLLAPPVEELLFRGVFYAGFRKSFGATVAALVTTGVFVFLHFPEFIYQPLAIVAITSLALVTLWLRLRTNAIGPSIAAHFGYNAVIAATLFVR